MLQICQTVGLLLCTHTALWWCSVRLPQMFSQIPVWALPKLLPVKPRFVSFGCVLWVLAKTWHFSLETWRFGAKPVCCVALWVKKCVGGGANSFQLKKSSPKAWCCLLLRASAWVVFSGWFVLNCSQESWTLVSSDHNIFSHMLSEVLVYIFDKFSSLGCFSFIRKCFQLATRSNPNFWRSQDLSENLAAPQELGDTMVPQHRGVKQR